MILQFKKVRIFLGNAYILSTPYFAFDKIDLKTWHNLKKT